MVSLPLLSRQEIARLYSPAAVGRRINAGKTEYIIQCISINHDLIIGLYLRLCSNFCNQIFLCLLLHNVSLLRLKPTFPSTSNIQVKLLVHAHTAWHSTQVAPFLKNNSRKNRVPQICGITPLSSRTMLVAYATG